ncbi:MAG: nucleotide-binding protein [Chloroflexi bacterium]|nr:nucleotide-binding protein [Chloroflexota bacterium]
MAETTCIGTTASGEPCKLKPGSSGYCHIHDPAKVQERELAQKAREKAWEKGYRLREVLEAISTVCRAKGWEFEISSLDEEEWKYATIQVSTYLDRKQVRGIINLTLAGDRFKLAPEVTSPFYRYGFNDLIDAIEISVSSLPWLQPSKTEPSKTHTKAGTTQGIQHQESGSPKKVFIVHGHDELAKESVARLVEKLDFKAIVLHEQPDQGRTIIEKFENYADAAFAVVLLTPDDFGGESADALRPRARQNVILEMGFFIGRLGRNRVCALEKGDIERPSDLSGVIWIRMDAEGAWKLLLGKEMREAGLSVDLNKIV